MKMIDTKEDRRKKRDEHEKRCRRSERRIWWVIGFIMVFYPALLLADWYEGASAGTMELVVVLWALIMVLEVFVLRHMKKRNKRFLVWLAAA